MLNKAVHLLQDAYRTLNILRRRRQVPFQPQKFLTSNGPHPYLSIYFVTGESRGRASNRLFPRIRAFTVGLAPGPRILKIRGVSPAPGRCARVRGDKSKPGLSCCWCRAWAAR